MQTNKKGFTLIELLVVITIIGLLSVGGFTQFQGNLAKGRDSQRITGLGEYYSSLNIYQLDNLYFPTNAAAIKGELVDGDYIADLILDPKQNTGTGIGSKTYGYHYATGRSEEDTTVEAAFEISVLFESQQFRKKWNDKDETLQGGDDGDRYEKSSKNEFAKILTVDEGLKIGGTSTTTTTTTTP